MSASSVATWGEKFPVMGNSESRDQEEGMCWLFPSRATSPERLASKGRCGRKCGHGGGRAEGLHSAQASPRSSWEVCAETRQILTYILKNYAGYTVKNNTRDMDRSKKAC